MNAARSMPLRWIDSKTKGSPTAVYRHEDGREFFLASSDNPLEEARSLIRDVPRNERTFYIVLGFGIGYHVRELLREMPLNSQILVIEPESACLSRLMKNSDHPPPVSLSDSRLHFLTCSDPGVVPIHMTDRMVRQRLLSIQMITHDPSIPTAENFYSKLIEDIPRLFPLCFESHRNSLDRMLENDLQNFWANLKHSWHSPPAGDLRGAWHGRPLLLVSPGPSLAGALPLLQKADRNYFLLAAAPAAGILLAKQIRPDVVVSVDPYAANRVHFQGWDTSNVPLVYYHRMYRGILPAYKGPKIHFVMQDEPPLPLIGLSERSAFWRGGSVAFSALQLAHLLEANPIIFAGQDFAFAGGHTHCAGSATNSQYDPLNMPADFFTVRGVEGHPVITNQNYNSYRLYLQNYLKDYAQLWPGVQHINTSPSGAEILGTESLPLDTVLDSLSEPAEEPGSDLMLGWLGPHRPPSPPAQKATVKRWMNELQNQLERAGHSEDFARVFKSFRATSLYAQAAKSYEDIYYLYDLRRGDEQDSTRNEFLNRFKAHLRGVQEDLRSLHAVL